MNGGTLAPGSRPAPSVLSVAFKPALVSPDHHRALVSCVFFLALLRPEEEERRWPQQMSRLSFSSLVLSLGAGEGLCVSGDL